MILIPWLDSLRTRIRRVNRRARRDFVRRSRPSAFAEILEDRTLLATFAVDSVADVTDANPGDGFSDDGAGNSTLRSAIQEANALTGADTITLPAGTFRLSLAGVDEDEAATGDLDVLETLTITGSGAGVTIIDAADLDRVLDVLPGAMLTISNVTITNGFLNLTSSNDGAGLRNQGALIIIDSVISDSVAANSGGGISNSGASAMLTVTDSTISGNSAQGVLGGGGVFNAGIGTITGSTIVNNASATQGGGISNSDIKSSGDLTISNSSISQNQAGATGRGGAIFNAAVLTLSGSSLTGNTASEGGAITNGGGFTPGAITIANVTISGNTATSDGGGIANNLDNALFLENSTVANNSATGEGGGIFNLGDVNLKSTLIGGNSADTAGADVHGTIISNGFNLIQDSADATGFVASDILDEDPLLGPLQNNGGVTDTHALLFGSPAIDAGAVNLNFPTDQRQIARPQDGDNDGSGAADIGSYEVQNIAVIPGSSNDLTLQLNGSTLELIDNLTGLPVLSTPFDPAAFVLVDGSGADDSLTVDLSGGNPIPGGGVTFNGKGETSIGDTLSVTGATVNAVTHDFTNASDGTIDIEIVNTSTISYTGLEPIFDDLSATQRVFTFAAFDDAVTLSDDDTAMNGVSRISSVSSSETVDFLSPTGTLTINGAGGNDFISLVAVDDLFLTTVAITVNGNDDNDTLAASAFDRDVTLIGGLGDDLIQGGAGDDDLNGKSGNDTITAGAGNDMLQGGSGRDSIDGGDGDDEVLGQGGSFDTVIGGAGNDTLDGGAGFDILLETADADFVLNDVQLTGNGTDVLLGFESATLTGGPGNNIFDASSFTGSVTFNGGDGDDVITGSAGNDRLNGDAGTDVLVGGGGDDTLRGGSGQNVLNGGDGNDVIISHGGGIDAITGGAGDDVLTGSDGDDVLVETANVDLMLTDSELTGIGTDTITGIVLAVLTGGAGDNEIDASGFSGNVTLIGSAGDDTLVGGSGKDSIVGGAGDDDLSGGADNDTLNGGAGADTGDGGDGDDVLFGGSGRDSLFGGKGNDAVLGQGSSFDTVSGGEGDDKLNGGAGTDVVAETGDADMTLTDVELTGLGTDVLASVEIAQLTGGAGANVIDASAFTGALALLGAGGDDRLIGGVGNDFLNGGSGRDTLTSNDGNDTLIGGAGRDLMDGGNGNDFLNGQGSGDTLIGSAGDDLLVGGVGVDSLLGRDGNDTLRGGDGDDILNGGAGNDVLFGEAGNDGLAGFTGSDFANGGAGDDTLVGGAGNDTLLGGAGKDIALGEAGADLVNGQGTSRDTLAGGSGSGADAGDVVVGLAGEIDETFTFFADWVVDT